MTSFPELGSRSSLSWVHTATAWRTALALVVVFVLLATSGWAVGRRLGAGPDPLSASLAAWGKGAIAGRPLPDTDSSPRRLARFFDSLTGAQLTRLVRRYPLAVGNLNGAPVGLRYRANRLALRQARLVERERTRDDRLTPYGQREAGRRVHRYEALLSQGRQILAFDPAGSGRVAEVFGNLATARRVSVVVPGVDTDLLTFERTRQPYRAPVGMARALYAAERSASPASRTAVIAWADYTSPAGIGIDAATGARAEDGARRLRATLGGLPGRSRAEVALFCHSYGSVVCGVAADDLPRAVTDIAVSGSPGMRAENLSDLGTSARVWAARDSGDWIADVPHLDIAGFGHGADPVEPDFGARVLSADGAAGHAGYFEPGTTSLANFAKVGVGAVTSVSCGGGDACTAGLI
ncbi:alpha/beta hydrolase [Streptomyces buecherae]|uniref:alpha/beta hydrolase n=1 Tax=Streptomyces buecherae TaxID=2763006 RepID=UPI001C26D02B|nr:alpha/beta hydrolase [Streptomyces buecherae]